MHFLLYIVTEFDLKNKIATFLANIFDIILQLFSEGQVICIAFTINPLLHRLFLDHAIIFYF